MLGQNGMLAQGRYGVQPRPMMNGQAGLAFNLPMQPAPPMRPPQMRPPQRPAAMNSLGPPNFQLTPAEQFKAMQQPDIDRQPERKQTPEQQQQQLSIPRPPHVVTLAVGNGQALTRLLQFSGNLSNESNTKYQLSWWNDLIKEYFTPKAVMKLTLWKDNQRHEAKPFEIGVPILPRFFLVTTQSGVKSMTLSLDGARERMYARGHAVVECVTAVWTYRYKNGYIVTLRGPLTAHVIITSPTPVPPAGSTAAAAAAATTNGAGNFILKFDDFQFDANYHDKYIALDAIQGTRTSAPDTIPPPMAGLSPRTPRLRNPTPVGSVGPSSGPSNTSEDDKLWEEPRLIIERGAIPGEPVNAFGIPQATMRCLELAESVAQMTDLITFASEQHLGPIEALAQFATKIRTTQPSPPQPPQTLQGQPQMMNGGLVNGYPGLPFGGPMGAPPFNSVPSTLYSSAPASITNPQQPPLPPSGLIGGTPMGMLPQSISSPSSIHNSPQKQHKTIPSGTGGSNSGSGSGPATPSGGVASSTNTPAMGNASLKRKQDASSPNATNTGGNVNAEPPNKRVTRTSKRGRTAGG